MTFTKKLKEMLMANYRLFSIIKEI
jgi:hypothetical protein